MEKRKIESAIIHCSDSDFGDRNLIDQWHRERGWNGIGYHYVITNGVLKSGAPYDPFSDGLIQTGRDVSIPGAHCKGFNKHSIGICLIGRHSFTAEQLWHSLPQLLSLLMFEHDLSPSQILGHNAFSRSKTCPNIPKEIITKIAEYSV